MVARMREAALISRGEIRRLLRDGHTLTYSIGVPVFLYPLLLIGVSQVIQIAQGAAERRVSRVAVLGAQSDPGLTEKLSRTPKLALVPPPDPSGAEPAALASDWIKGGLLDALLIARPEGAAEETVEIHSNGAREASQAALRRLEPALSELRLERLRAEAARLGEGAPFLEPLRVEEVDVVPPARRVREELARVAPLLLLLMAGIGAFYPALDATVAEKERGTLETTLLLPVAPSSLALGRFVPVAAFAILSVALNFASLFCAVVFFLVPGKLDLTAFPPLSELAAALGAAALLSLLISAAMCAVALFARSFKEGQSYLGPVLLVTVFVGMAAIFPEVRLTPAVAAVPVLDLALLFRDALSGKLEPLTASICFGSSLLHTAAALCVAARLARDETVLLGSPAAGRFPYALGRAFRRRR